MPSQALLKSVQVSVLNQGWIRPELCNFLLNLVTSDSRYKIHINYPNARPISNNRNIIAREFNHDYLLMIDSDVIPHRNPLDLVDLDKDIIACPCPQWHKTDLYWVAMYGVNGGYKQVSVYQRKGLQQVDAVGTGCILIAKRVLIKIKAPFMVNWLPNGIQGLGQDFYFCQKSKKAGFKVWVHWGYPCSHFKEIDMLDVLNLLTKDK